MKNLKKFKAQCLLYKLVYQLWEFQLASYNFVHINSDTELSVAEIGGFIIYCYIKKFVHCM